MNATLEGISLHVADVEHSLEFYLKLPGAELVYRRADEFARLRIGTGFLHLVRLPKPGFHIEINVDDVQMAHDQSVAAGLAPSHLTRHPWGKTDFHLTDPDGNILELGAMLE
jgi:catechol 2,3-dioxygenase-like lactoylglutathione lyase family enzyme